MLLNDWASLAIICMLGAFSPGPSLIVILSLTSTDGRRSGYDASLGHGCGIFVYAFMSASGLAIILNLHKGLFALIQFLGAIFLLYLGLRIMRSIIFKASEESSKSVLNQNYSNRFTDGFLIAILNPKIAVFFLSLFSQFLRLEQNFIIHLGMATLAGVIDTVAYVLMVSLASTQIMLKFLSTYKTSVEFCFGLLLIALSISLSAKILIDYFY